MKARHPIGYIYFIQAGADGPIKIGYTAQLDPNERLLQLQAIIPIPIKLLGVIEGSLKTEIQLLKELSPWRRWSEWFEPHPIVLAAVNLALELGKRWDGHLAPLRNTPVWAGKRRLRVVECFT